MAIAFNKTKGAAQKRELNTLGFHNGMNTMRLVGDVLPRYVYWITGENAKDIPFECLSFDRDQEKFTNVEKDWVKAYFPDKKFTWSYVTQCLDRDEEGNLVIRVVNLKKKLFEQILTAAEDLGDPTDWDKGWDIVFERKKTGPLPYNVEYTLHVLKCKERPLSDEEKAFLEENLKSMDEVMPRPSPEAQKELLDRIRAQLAPEAEDKDTIEKEFQTN